MLDRPGNVFLADCPARLTLELLSDKWSVLVIQGLIPRPLRHAELVTLIGGVSRKVLTQTLRHLQQNGLVERHAASARTVTYQLTELGRSLQSPIEALNAWAAEHGSEVTEFREPAEADDIGRSPSAG
ncbi:helix-turn-helix transcriptional regulator [Leifsonia sp. ZF2019]|uniref:winged helix-turn-helix transcriptional regulator n=1 Tax=Leifsonia sp. ZF2019 TaxID=2781978 RepID=UPI001CBF9B0B|nr:helix-turn-helix domain-containing protein [Leifsonia sp. ZF2019]UAJ80685.1 helix-turn-helix transcriptional regulator [Leifsonia sp. ZF2019]